MKFYEYLWNSVNIYEYKWNSMNIDEILWISSILLVTTNHSWIPAYPSYVYDVVYGVSSLRQNTWHVKNVPENRVYHLKIAITNYVVDQNMMIINDNSLGLG